MSPSFPSNHIAKEIIGLAFLSMARMTGTLVRILSCVFFHIDIRHEMLDFGNLHYINSIIFMVKSCNCVYLPYLLLYASMVFCQVSLNCSLSSNNF